MTDAVHSKTFLNLNSPKLALPCPYNTTNMYKIIDGAIYIVGDAMCYGICVETLNDHHGRMKDFILNKEDFVNNRCEGLLTDEHPYKVIHYGTYAIGVIHNFKLYVHKNWISMLS